MRHFLIDTDTASDDAVAIIMALKCKDVKVEAIVVENGNLPVDLAVKNAFWSIKTANTYAPPVYRGVDRPLLKECHHGTFIHGTDGMSEMNLPDPEMELAKGHGVLQILEYANKFAGELEIVALGPLTGIALALRLDPDLPKKVKRLYIMGTPGFGPGNTNAVAEFNIWADAEACKIVLESGMEQMYIGWDVSCGDAVITDEEISYIEQNGSDCARFCMRCNERLMEVNKSRFGSRCLDMADPVAMAVALWPEIVKEDLHCYTYVETAPCATYGQVVFDYVNRAGMPKNAHMSKSLHIEKMKQLMFAHME